MRGVLQGIVGLAVLVQAALVSLADEYLRWPEPSVRVEKQRGQDEMLTPAEMKQDLDRLSGDLLQAHPATVEGFTASQRKCVEEAHARCQKPMSIREFRLVAAKVASMLDDPDTWVHRRKEGQDLFGLTVDLPVRWFDEGLYVTETTRQLRKGDKIFSIGGRTPERLLQEYRQSVGHDNVVEMKVELATNLRFERVLESWQVLERNSDYVEVEYQRGGQAGHVRLALERRPVAVAIGNGPAIRGGFDAARSLLVIMPLRFCLDDEMPKEIEAAFDRWYSGAGSQRARETVIDLRKGPDDGLSFLTGKLIHHLDVPAYKDCHFYTRYSNPYRRSLELLLPDARMLQTKAARHDGLVGGCDKPVTNHRVPENLRFSGRVWVLVSPHSARTDVQFACVLQDNNLATIVGEQPGCTSSRGLSEMILQLPVSKLLYAITYDRLVRPDLTKGEALIPDVIVPTRIEDVVAGRDPQMEKIYTLIQTPAKKESPENPAGKP